MTSHLSKLYTLLKRLFAHLFRRPSLPPPPPPAPAPRIPAYLLPRPPITDLQGAHHAILSRHSEQLKQPLLVQVLSSGDAQVEEAKSANAVDLVGIGVQAESSEELAAQLSQWTTQSTTQISAAKSLYSSRASPHEISWPVVRFALLQASATYLRNLDNVKLAVMTGEVEAKQALGDSQRAIVQLAESWGMGFTVLCDLVDNHPIEHWCWDGPFCGAYYSNNQDKEPFIVVAFKGTTPANLGEWFVDLDFTAAAAAPDPLAGGAGKVLWGEAVSKGVAQALFEEYEVAEGKGKEGAVPFDLIVMGLQDLSQALGGTQEKQVPVYVTGHSLGASYATLFYAESLRRFSPTTTSQPFQLVDLHTFGSPRLSLAPFGLSLRALTDILQVHSWRLVDKGDLVPSIPPVDCWGEQFEHVDLGVQVSEGEGAVRVESELGRGMPRGWFEGSVEKHMCESYWAAVVSAEEVAEAGEGVALAGLARVEEET